MSKNNFEKLNELDGGFAAEDGELSFKELLVKYCQPLDVSEAQAIIGGEEAVDPSPDLDIAAIIPYPSGVEYPRLENETEPIYIEPGQTLRFSASYDEYSFPPVSGYQWDMYGDDDYHDTWEESIWDWEVPASGEVFELSLQLLV